MRVLPAVLPHARHVAANVAGVEIRFVEGRIVEIARTVTRPGEAAFLIEQTAPVYEVRVSLERDYVTAYGERRALQPGMGLRADIPIDRRRLWQQLFDPLLAAAPGSGEIFLINNDMEPPRTDQFNLGIRQKFGDFQTALTFAAGNTTNLFAWYIANAGSETGDRFSGPTPGSVGHPEFRNLIFFGNNDAEQTFRAMYLTVDKPFDTDSGWGMQFTYTLSKSERNGTRDNGLTGFDFDYNRPGLSPTFPTNQDERHRIVATGIVALPFDFRLSGVLTLGSGLPFHQFVCPAATNPDICWNGGRPEGQDFLFTDTFAFRQIDLRLTKEFQVFNGQSVEVILDAVNVFNFENYSNFEQCLCSAQYGEPRGQHLPTRSFQLGLRYRW